MIEIIRPIPAHLDAEQVQRLAAMTPARVRDHLHEYRCQRRERTDRLDRDRADRGIEACQFVLSECEPIEVRIFRQRCACDALQHQLDQHRAIVADMEERISAHRIALVELAMMADGVAA